MKDYEEKIFLKKGGDELLYRWAVEKFSDGDKECYDIGIKFYEKAAECGHALALNNLGALYLEGRFVEKNPEKAERFYIKSAEKGCYEACCNLGYYYLYGRNGQVDYKKAFEYFIIGAILGNDGNCVYKLGDMYMYGNHVEKSPEIAFRLYCRALDVYRNYGCSYEDEFLSDIYYRIGKCLYDGVGTEKDEDESTWYLEEALEGYEARGHDAYGYVEKRIDEIKNMLK